MQRVRYYIKRIYLFSIKNRNKSLYFRALLLSAKYRIMILCVPMTQVQEHMGVKGMESTYEESNKNLHYAYTVGRIVNLVCSHTPWESKCFVRALTAQYLLKRKRISSTIYLGCGKEGNSLIAHAWLRCGSIYVSGGNGKDFSVVAKFGCSY